MHRNIVLLFILLSFSVRAQTLNLLPDIPEPATNPHIATAFNGVKTGNVTFTKSFAESDEMLLAALAYLHPASPYQNQQPVLDRLTLLLDTVLGGWNNGRMALNDMQFCFHATVSYLMLKQYQPTGIPANRKADWEAGIRKNIDKILSTNINVYTNHIVGAIWLNGDIRLAMGIYFGSLAIDDAVSANIAKTVIEDIMPQTLLPDGATHYVGYQNESPSYHGEAMIRPYAWYYLLTRSQKVNDFICSTKNYIPLMQIPLGEGFKEWSTSPAWKPYYNRTSLKPEALAKAYLSGDGLNYEIGKGSQSLFLAFLYRSGLTAKALPDNYHLYDKNSMGPRGRWGNWGVVGTLRDPSVPAPELTETRFLNMDGVSTLVGAFTLNSNATSTTYPLNAAFQGAAPEVKYAAGKETDWQRGAKWAFLTGKDRSDAQTRTNSVYGLSTRYGVSKTRFNELPWKALQQWVVTPDRVIGMTEMEATASSTVYGLAQRIQLVSGRRNASGTRKTLNTIDANTFEYGDLRLKIISKDYAGTVNTVYHGVMNDALDTLSVMIELHDANSGNDVSQTYPAGTRRYAFFEVTNKDRSYSSNAVRLTLATGLEGFEFQESAGRKVRMIHNTTGSAVALNTSSMTSPYTKSRMVKSWDESMLTNLSISTGNTTIPYTSIPAYGHVLVINSSIADDHVAGYQTYDSIFNPSVGTDLKEPFKKKVNPVTLKNGIIQIHKTALEGMTAIEVYDLKGVSIKKKISHSSESDVNIDLSNQPNGFYLVEIRSNKDLLKSYKILK